MGVSVMALDISPLAQTLFVTLPATLGGVEFVAASHLSLKLNGGCGSMHCRDLGWHVSVQNLLGSFLFLIGAANDLYISLQEQAALEIKLSLPSDDGIGVSTSPNQWDTPHSPPTLHQPAIGDDLIGTKIPYLVGSVCFLIASTMDLWLWKQERFGLALGAPLSQFAPIDHHSASAAVSWVVLNDVGTRRPPPTKKQRKRVTLLDAVAIFFYVFTCCAAIMDFSIVCLTARRFPRYILDSAAVVILCAGAIITGSVVNRVPPKQPYTGLLYGLRVVIVIFGIDKWWEMASWFAWAGGFASGESV
eukprot:CAMPEP_0171917234 /NCGR_PEP_ID=MMETSP0993-20121228/15760_1 /TAXON_ID=483369 /ORGANISM="non described non described, Strain CCMP2098" /LENGTH=303 /DNA_ID=CAMNT_0012553007 /DNA_START=1 /DNA_END=912 /DNA_ORIENTATION=-